MEQPAQSSITSAFAKGGVGMERLRWARSGLAVLRYRERDRAGETFTVNTTAGASGKVQLSAVAFDKVPEPASITLMGAGLGGVAFLRRRGKRAGRSSAAERRECLTYAPFAEWL